MSTRRRSETETTKGRREFLGQLAAATTAVTLGAGSAAAAIPRVVDASTSSADPEHWLDGLKGKHRQLVDGFAPNEGFPLAFARTFLATQGENPDAGAVIIL